MIALDLGMRGRLIVPIKTRDTMDVYIVLGLAVMMYIMVMLLVNSDLWKEMDNDCHCDDCRTVCHCPVPSVRSVSSKIDIECR
ncbi:unnamed protein product [Colias eurytheme]|nr:unnamed protein product [Colias eurytheme]